MNHADPVDPACLEDRPLIGLREEWAVERNSDGTPKTDYTGLVLPAGVPEKKEPPRLATPSLDDFVLPSGPVGLEEASEVAFSRLAALDELYLQGDEIVEVRDRDDPANAEIVGIDQTAFRSRLELVGRLFEYRKNGPDFLLGPGLASELTAKAMMKTRAKRLLKPLALLVRSAIITEGADGNLCILGSGYYPFGGGKKVICETTPPEVPLAESLRGIYRPFEDFKFQTEGDARRAIAYVILPALVLGGLVPDHAPISLVEAEPGSNKEYLQDVTAAFYGEIPYLTSKKRTSPGGFDEQLGEGMLRGRPFIKIDNGGNKFDSEYLETLLTAERAPARVCYGRAVEVDPRHHFFCITTNEAPITPRLRRRCWIIRIRPRSILYVRGRYREGNGRILNHILANQPYYLGCIFAVIKEWHRLGKQRTNEMRHSFDGCTQVLDWIMQNIFKTDPLFADYDASGEPFPTFEETDTTLFDGLLAPRPDIVGEPSAQQI